MEDKKLLPLDKKIAKDSNNLSINVHKFEAMLLAFQLWPPAWHRKKVIIHTNNTTAIVRLEDLMLQKSTNAFLY